MTDATGFAPLVPGFEFLQSLVKNAGAALPGIGQWVAPTLNPEELEKRIGELRTVQFWLEQNARMLGVTIQALEVQRMTLSTLKTMNVQMGDLRDSLTIRRPPEPAPAAEAAPAAAAEPAAAKPDDAPAAPPMAGMVDPMQWWGALTQQFTQLATATMKDGAADVAKNLAGAMAASAPAAAAAGDEPAPPGTPAAAAAGARPAARKKPAAG